VKTGVLARARGAAEKGGGTLKLLFEDSRVKNMQKSFERKDQDPEKPKEVNLLGGGTRTLQKKKGGWGGHRQERRLTCCKTVGWERRTGCFTTGGSLRRAVKKRTSTPWGQQRRKKRGVGRTWLNKKRRNTLKGGGPAWAKASGETERGDVFRMGLKTKVKRKGVKPG